MGYGDDIMATAMARQIKKRRKNNRVIVGNGKKEHFSPIFRHNPNIDHLPFIQKNDKVVWIKNYPGHRSYIDYARSTRHRLVFTRFYAVPGDFFFSKNEIESAKRAAHSLQPFVVIEPNVKKTVNINKDWGFHKWQRVVGALKYQIRFVQLGNRDSKTLKGVTRLVTRHFREACAILSFAKLFAGTEGGLHHAAAALGIPGVIIFGGRISPKTTGYRLHTNLYVKHPRSPCGRVDPCDHCRQCMEKISTRQVIDALENKLKTLN